jgi:hypothetical protein
VSKRQAIDYPDSAPLLDDIVAWPADGNWPVAKSLADLLVSIGPPTTPALQRLLQGADAAHQYFGLSLVVSRLPPDVAVHLRKDLKQIVKAPTTGQVLEGVSKLAADILRRFDDVRPKEQS